MLTSNEHEWEALRYTENGKNKTAVRCKKCKRLWHHIDIDEYCEAL